MFQSAKKSFPSKPTANIYSLESTVEYSQIKHYSVFLYKPNQYMSDGQNVSIDMTVAISADTDILDWLEEMNQELEKDDQWELHCALSSDELLSEPLEF